MSAFEIEELTVDDYEVSFRFEGPKGAELGVKLLRTIKNMGNHELEHFIENNNLKQVSDNES